MEGSGADQPPKSPRTPGTPRAQGKGGNDQGVRSPGEVGGSPGSPGNDPDALIFQPDFGAIWDDGGTEGFDANSPSSSKQGSVDLATIVNEAADAAAEAAADAVSDAIFNEGDLSPSGSGETTKTGSPTHDSPSGRAGTPERTPEVSNPPAKLHLSPCSVNLTLLRLCSASRLIRK